MNPKISVIMPVFNNSEYLIQAIESVLNQTYQNFELVIVDDASTDPENSKIYGHYCHHPNVKIFTIEENMGISAAKNLGMQAATGEYIAWLASDDMYKPTFLAEVLAAAEYYRGHLIFTNYDFMTKDGDYTGTHNKVPVWIIPSKPIDIDAFNDAVFHVYKSWNMFVNYDCIFGERKFFEGSNAFWEGVREHEDLYHILHVTSVMRVPFVYLDSRLVMYRLHDKQTTATKTEQHKKNYVAITNKIITELIDLGKNEEAKKFLG